MVVGARVVGATELVVAAGAVAGATEEVVDPESVVAVVEQADRRTAKSATRSTSGRLSAVERYPPEGARGSERDGRAVDATCPHSVCCRHSTRSKI